MRTIIHLFTITLCFLSTNIFAQDNQDEIVAVWNTADETKVEIYKEGNIYLGNPINPEGKRNTEIEVLKLEYKEGKWVGKIYSKKKRKVVRCRM